MLNFPATNLVLSRLVVSQNELSKGTHSERKVFDKTCPNFDEADAVQVNNLIRLLVLLYFFSLPRIKKMNERKKKGKIKLLILDSIRHLKSRQRLLRRWEPFGTYRKHEGDGI